MRGGDGGQQDVGVQREGRRCPGGARHNRIPSPLPDLLRRLVPHGRCLRVRVAPHRPRGASLAPGSAAGPCPARAQRGIALAPGSSRAIQDSPFSREFGVPLVPPAAAAPAAPAHGASPAGAEPLAGARLAGNSLHPGLVGARRRPAPLGAPRPCQDVPGLSHPSLPKAGAGADAPGAAARPRHLRHRHRARGALGRPRLQRHLQPLLLQVRPLRPRPCPGHRCGPRDTAGGLGPAAPLCPSSCLLLIHPNQDICSQVGAAPPCGAGGLREPRGAPKVAGPGPAHFPLFPSPAGGRMRGWRRKSSSCCTCCWCSAAAR